MRRPLPAAYLAPPNARGIAVACQHTPPRVTDAASQHKLLLEHIHAVRDTHDLHNVQLVFIPESNLGFEAQHAVAAMQRAGLSRWLALAEGARGQPGLLTTHATKAAMCKAVQELLEFQALHVSDELVCLSQSPQEAIRQLFVELRGYTVVVEAPKSVFGKAKQTFSGKIGGQQDDLVVALQLCVLGARIFLRNSKYSHFR